MGIEVKLVDVLAPFRFTRQCTEEKVTLIQTLIDGFVRHANVQGSVEVRDEIRPVLHERYDCTYGGRDRRGLVKRLVLDGHIEIVGLEYHNFRALPSDLTPDERYFAKHTHNPDPSHPLIKHDNKYYVLESVAFYFA